MEPTSIESQVIEINATVQRHADIIPNLLAAHAISGCDTVASVFGIGKPTVITALRKNNISLSSIGNLGSPIDDVLKEGTIFFLHCYGQSKVNTMTDA